MINNKILGLLGLASRAGKICFGADMVEEDLKRKKIKLLIIAKDSSENTKSKFIKLADESGINYVIDGEIDSLSKAIGKNNKALIGIKDMNFARELNKKYNGGDTIG